jgi:acid phosphatase family membrane protein YuiD
MSPYLWAAGIAWIIAQGSKYLIAIIQSKTVRKFRSLYISGGMPSAHSATVMAVTTVVGLRDGIDSGLFGIVALLSAIVMYDAVMVRRSSGLQGDILTQLLKDTKSKIIVPRFAHGHQPLEVVVGAGLGCVIGAIVFFATK